MTEVTKARLRAYNVGFGDCLLLTLSYTDNAQRSILIDFGSTRLPSRRATKQDGRHRPGHRQRDWWTPRHGGGDPPARRSHQRFRIRANPGI